MVKNNIKKYRKRYDISQNELAIELSCTKQYISKLELGKTSPSIEVCFKILKALENIVYIKSEGSLKINLKMDNLFYDEEYDL